MFTAINLLYNLRKAIILSAPWRKFVKEPPPDLDALVQVGAIASTQLLANIQTLITSSRNRVAQAVNAELVLLYWHIGRRIRSGILGEGRAEYGE